MSEHRQIPAQASAATGEVVSFAVAVIDSSGLPFRLETLLAKTTGRPRQLPVRALLVALLVLALDDRALRLKAATRVLFSLPDAWREELGVRGEARTRKAFLARYRQVRYLFHLTLSVMDPSVEAKNRVEDQLVADKRRKILTKDEVESRTALLASVVNDLVMASVKVLDPDELSGYDGSVGLDATVVPLFSRGPVKASNRSASDPDGGWYIRCYDDRDPAGPPRKQKWALEATIIVMGRPLGSVPAYPNLVLGVSLARPGVDPGGLGTRLLASVVGNGFKAG